MIEISEYAPNRSKEQNAYYWIVNKSVADCLDAAGCTYGEFGLPYTKDIIHDINKRVFGKKTTSDMPVREFCEFMDKVILFWKEKTNNNFSLPEPPVSYFQKRGYFMTTF
jgi:hypothetical protein